MVIIWIAASVALRADVDVATAVPPLDKLWKIYPTNNDIVGEYSSNGGGVTTHTITKENDTTWNLFSLGGLDGMGGMDETLTLSTEKTYGIINTYTNGNVASPAKFVAHMNNRLVHMNGEIPLILKKIHKPAV
jgi:hypothetical protein